MNINHQQREVLLTIRETVARTAPKGSDEFEAGAAKACEMLLIHIDWLLEQVNAGHSIPLTVKVNPKWPFDAQVVRTNPPWMAAHPDQLPPMVSAPEPSSDATLQEALRCAMDEVGLSEPWQRRHLTDRLAFHARRMGGHQQPAPQPLTEDEAVAALQRLSYAAGAAYGWNCCVNGDEAGFQRSQDMAEALRVLRDRKAPQQPASQPLAYYFPGSDVEIPSVSLVDDLTDEQKRNCIPLVPAKGQTMSNNDDKQTQASQEQPDACQHPGKTYTIETGDGALVEFCDHCHTCTHIGHAPLPDNQELGGKP